MTLLLFFILRNGVEMYKECSDTFKNDHELKELFDLSVNMNNPKIKEREAKLNYKLNCKKFSFGKSWENNISVWFEFCLK